jgi:hypothetical protein
MPVTIDETAFEEREVYASMEDVLARNRQRTFTATSVPNASDVQGFLRQTAGELDTLLVQKGYSLPIPTTAVRAWEYLRNLNALGAHLLVEQSAPTTRRDQLEATRLMWKDAKKMLADAESVLDIPRAISRSGARGPGVTPAPVQAATSYFTRDMRF